MALPVLNESPVYELKQPSTGEIKRFRPFLVREQKNLLIANESQDPRQMMNAILNSIQNCVEDVDITRVSTTDADYMFTMIRSKSVGESTSVVYKCKECGHSNKVEIDLTKVEVNGEKQSNTIKLTDQVSIRMKHPTYMDMIQNSALDNPDKYVETTLSTITACIDAVLTEEEQISLKDETKESIENFINSLTTQQFEKVMKYINSIPTMKYTSKFECESCHADNNFTLEGMQDFFS
tara:strand:+ start:1234 stop:1944 length:711 start_codon:yes stop_codon:yes gene_type:complete